MTRLASIRIRCGFKQSAMKRVRTANTRAFPKKGDGYRATRRLIAEGERLIRNSKMRNKLLTGAATALLFVGLFAAPSFAEDTKPPRPAAADMQKFAKERCSEHSARIAGGLAYLEARLKPTAAQLPAWNKWRDITLANAKAAEQACSERPFPTKGKDGAPTIIERRAFMVKMLTLKLDAIKASQPALETLYQSLDTS
ncbi:MAG: Spy/CpxP family protein refolding chaperone, partial [Parvibaculum sedimenti]|uniref:Spy/CpxP family protein refolding chaperone n=1 Tax=Parvibaculum sedimenti TaxID=2608632 RepID=UPI003BB48ADE